MPPPVFLVTCAAFPDGDEEELGLLVEGCTRAGLAPRWVAWDDPDIDWAAAAVSVVRSTWDYTPRREEFLAWTRRVPGLLNPFTVIEWNSDKSYLQELAAAGVPVVPTTWVTPGDPADQPTDLVVDLPVGRDFVVKPSVGAGSRGVGRFAGDDPGAPRAARSHIAHLHEAGRTVMVQPYIDAVDDLGETALIFVDSRFSHAVDKASMLPEPVAHQVTGGVSRELFVAERISPRVPDAAEMLVAEAALAAVPWPGDLLYARVDLLPGPAGPVVVELELAEPSLFLNHAPGSADRLARAIAARVDA